MNNKKFFSKVLLFGEYGIIKNSKALVIPYKKYYGSLKFSIKLDNVQKASNINLKQLSNYIKNNEFVSNKINTLKLDTDIENGLYFESTIPENYGLGSSGSVVAAIYESYKKKVFVDLEISDLKLIFSLMESFFHGQSSGIDPLSCYVQKPLLVDSKNSINTIDIPPQNINSKRTLFLIDTDCKGNTQGLVEIFLNKLRQKDFEVFFENEFVVATNNSITNFLERKYEDFESNFIELSKKTFNNFQEMIPINYKNLWMDGIEKKDYYLKLCGSGGGGFLIGLTTDLDKVQKLFPTKKIEELYRF
tara:strand:+ start:5469 stop:6380 length:912 start_codon:yes stop_codon:yes gene_type:complete